MEKTNDVPRLAFYYYGAKWNIAPWIISFFPEHMNYIEPCGGSAAILLRKPESLLETYNDLNKDVFNFFLVLRDRRDELIEKIKLTPWSKDEFEYCKNTCIDDPVEHARRFLVSSTMSISHSPFKKASGFRTISYYNQVRSRKGSTLQGKDKELLAIAKRFERVQITNRDALEVIDKYSNGEDTLIYFDPPYLKDTRKSKDLYLEEVDNNFHIEAAKLLRNKNVFAIVSGYKHELYKEIYEDYGWPRVDKQFQGNSGSIKTESIWISPSIISLTNIPGKKEILL